MTREQRRTYIIVGIIALLVIGPLVMLSPWGMDYLESVALSHSSERWAATLEIGCADTYKATLRRDEALAAYEAFYRTFTTDPRRGYAKYMIAACMELDNSQSRQATVTAYQDFLEEFEDDPQFQTLEDWRFYVNEAERAVLRIKIN